METGVSEGDGGIVAIVFRGAAADDLDEVLRLYRQLHHDDPVLSPGDASRLFEIIASNRDLHLFV